MGGAGPWLGLVVGKGEKYTPPQAGERAGVGNFAGGPWFLGPRRPRNERTLVLSGFYACLISWGPYSELSRGGI